ncbi:LysR family transcriptional regulator [Chelativorans sp. AA-79]|uniref:LysR family transcriptional regulator n=1 Tax=Chelativorans sp. AA-79 TaxID=3028735 RepID=UPI0023F85870|nr:LysR family transcriptional regulator [Chelativorans sp. AA-79]WEX10765.1 LysR family transcriptional regulator [Chelativorans sp. AA-79]
MNLRHLRLLDAVARYGTLQVAAQQMGLTQPAVSQGICRLEGIYSVKLFERGRNGARPSEEGELVLLRVRRLMAFIAQMRRRVNGGRRDRPQVQLQHLITLSQLEILHAVENCRGFAAAARELGIAEPTVHRGAREVERIVEKPLFRSAGNGIEITPIGRDLARLAGLALREIEVSFEDLDALRGRRGGRLVIGSLPLARTDLLPTAITELHKIYPDAFIEIAEGSYEHLIERLRRGDIDAIIGALRGQANGGDLIERKLLRDSLSVIARRGHPLSTATELDRSTLLTYPWIVSRKGTPTRNHFNAMFGGGSPNGGLIECSSLVILRALLIKSDNLALLSRRQVKYEENLGMLVSLPIDLPETTRDIGVTTRRNWKPTVLQSTFLDILDEVVRTEQDVPQSMCRSDA